MRLNSITQPLALAHSLGCNYSMRCKFVIEFDIVLQRICNEYVSLIAFPNIDKLIERHNRFTIRRHYFYAFSLLFGRQVNAFIIHTFTSDQFIIRIEFHLVLSFLNASSFRQLHSTKKNQLIPIENRILFASIHSATTQNLGRTQSVNQQTKRRIELIV